MHQVDLSLKREITKVEGAATLDVEVKDGRVQHCRFGITEYKRFYTQAMRGKPYKSLPQLLARICGTCSNAHLLCSIEACEHALGITPTPQSQRLKHLTMYGLNLRDHALHLYLFALPDMYGKDAFLSFDERDPEQHQILHDAFDIKGAGNYLSTIVAGRSVHAVHPAIGGFTHVPTPDELSQAVAKLQAVRPAVLRTIERFAHSPFRFDRQTKFMALVADPFNYLEGEIVSDAGHHITEQDFARHLERVVIPYSEASGYTFEHHSYMVGALARLNLSQQSLHPNTKASVPEILARFPSTNIYDNNLAQAVELLQCVDQSLELLQQGPFTLEPLVEPARPDGIGVGVIEAPRGTLYHQVEINAAGLVVRGQIVVPTGQNQINIEQDLARLVEELLPSAPSEDQLQHELEKLIRAYDPCMSCASHFLKLRIGAAAA